MFLVKKKDGSTRSCVDYRQLIKVMIEIKHPLQMIDESMDQRIGEYAFSKIELRLSCLKIWVKDEDSWRKYFRTWYKHYQYLDQFIMVYIEAILI